jgi:hypothetical protein
MRALMVRPLAELVSGDPLVELDSAWAAAWAAMATPADAALLTRCCRRMAEILGHPRPIDADADADVPVSADAERAGMALTEQYLIDVSAATDEQVAELASVLDGSVIDFVTALLVVEQRIRLELGLSAVLDGDVRPGSDPRAESDPLFSSSSAPQRVPVQPTTPARSPRAPGASRNAELGASLLRFAAAAMRNDAVDPVTTELVRLRCATYHDCHT